MGTFLQLMWLAFLLVIVVIGLVITFSLFPPLGLGLLIFVGFMFYAGWQSDNG